MAFFTDFNVRGHVGLLDWYTGFDCDSAVAMLGAHGATYLTLKTEARCTIVRKNGRSIFGSQLSRCSP